MVFFLMLLFLRALWERFERKECSKGKYIPQGSKCAFRALGVDTPHSARPRGGVYALVAECATFRYPLRNTIVCVCCVCVCVCVCPPPHTHPHTHTHSTSSEQSNSFLPRVAWLNTGGAYVLFSKSELEFFTHAIERCYKINKRVRIKFRRVKKHLHVHTLRWAFVAAHQIDPVS